MEDGQTLSFSPFVLKHVDITGNACSKCHWSKRCYGCIIEPSDSNSGQLIQILLKNTYIACEWDISFYEQFSDPQGCSAQFHESMETVRMELEKPLQLETCIKLFSQGDIVETKCNKCNTLKPCNKKMTFQGCPPVLMLHLKRFKVSA